MRLAAILTAFAGLWLLAMAITAPTAQDVQNCIAATGWTAEHCTIELSR